MQDQYALDLTLQDGSLNSHVAKKEKKNEHSP